MGEMRRRKAIPLAFNMSFGLIPVILCMLLSEFILDEHALYISSLVGLIYSFGSYYLSRKRIYNFVLYISTGILILLSATTLLSMQMFPWGTLPFTLEVMMFIMNAILFFGQNIIRRIFNLKKCPECDSVICKSLDSSIASAKVISIMGILHCITIAIFLAFFHPLTKEANLILFQILPPFLLLSSIIINQMGIRYANHVFSQEEEVPIVNKQGTIIGRTYLSEAPIYKNDFINPVIRIAFIHNGMLFLSKRKANCITESNKIDLPLEIYLRFGEKIDEGIKRLLHYPYPDGSTVHPRFGIKHLFKNEETNRLIYLHIAYIEDEKLLQSSFFQNGKLWTFQQIEHNLGKNFFSKCFEEEYPYLKESVKIWEEYK